MKYKNRDTGGDMGTENAGENKKIAVYIRVGHPEQAEKMTFKEQIKAANQIYEQMTGVKPEWDEPKEEANEMIQRM